MKTQTTENKEVRIRMAIKKYVAISYCFIILSIYFSSMAYALTSENVNKNYNKEILPQTAAMNATVSVVSSISSFSGIIFGIIGLILTILFLSIRIRAMGSAI